MVNRTIPSNRMMRNKGFAILTILLLAVFLIGALTAYMMDDTSLEADHTRDNSYALSIVSEGDHARKAWDLVVSSGVIPSNTTFSQITDPLVGGYQPSTLPSSILNDNSYTIDFIYRPAQIAIEGVGTTSPDYVFVTAFKQPGASFYDTSGSIGIRKRVCQQINAVVNDRPVSETPFTVTAVSSTDWVGGATPATRTGASGTLIDMTGVTYSAISGWRSGCVKLNGTGDYVYFTVAGVM